MNDIDKEFLVQIGENLRRIRKEKDLTLIDLEKSTGIQNGDISKIERGKKNVVITTLYKLAKGLNVHLRELVTLEGEI